MLPLPAGGAPQLFFLAAVAALIGGLSAIERKGAFQLMLSRPIVLAPILGWGMGDAEGGRLPRNPQEQGALRIAHPPPQDRRQYDRPGQHQLEGALALDGGEAADERRDRREEEE